MKRVHVAAAVIRDGSGQILIARRAERLDYAPLQRRAGVTADEASDSQHDAGIERSRTAVEIPPTRLEIDGVPNELASQKTAPKDSASEGTIK